MNIEEFREYCIKKPGVTEELPFGPDTLVFKVMGKMFALCDLNQFDGFNAKCDPERAVQLREQYPDGIKPGYHMSKIHWNTVSTHGCVPRQLMQELIDHSYQLIVSSLSKKVQLALKEMSH
ncbi:MAG: MmcQ/YjbR family DNA-binding protein [Flavobacteriales bacterium]